MNDLRQRIANLSPEKRALFDQLLMQQMAAGAKGQAIPRRDASAPCPLSFAQQRLWFLDQFEPDSPLYNVAKAFRVQGALDVAALRQALEAIVARHEVLRTTFAAEDGNPVQVIGEPGAVPLSVIELGALPAAEREAELYRQLTREVRRPFDLARDVMLRGALYQVEPGGARIAAHDAPYRLRCLVHGCAAARVGGLVPGLCDTRAPSRCPPCRSSMPTTRSGSGTGCKGKC